MEGKICLVTGATSGIGEHTALGLAHKKATVVIVGRDREKCKNTVARICQETNNPNIEHLVADLSSMEDIRRIVNEFQGNHNHLNVLVNNVGGAFWRREVSVDGIEMTFALNHLSYFLITNLLLKEIKRGSPARIINVSSGSHKRHRLDFNDLQLNNRYNPVSAYGRSKLANVLFTYELVRRLDGSLVTANAISPGTVSTTIWRNSAPLVGSLLWWYVSLFGQTPEQGARGVIHLASSPEVGGVSGKYFRKRVMSDSSPETYNLESARRLWEISAHITGFV